jgi:hypothetical protein
MRDGGKSYWEGTGFFTPTGGSIEYFIDASEEGPGEEQRTLYKRIEARYAELLAGLAPLFAESYREWCHDEPPADIWSVFAVGSVSVPRVESREMEWELAFDCRDDAEHTFTALMRGWEPRGPIRIDG